MKKTRYALYLAGFVDSAGNVEDPIFIRTLKTMPAPAEIPKNCMAVTETFDGRYWSSEEDVYPDHHDGWRKGDFCLGSYIRRKPQGGGSEVWDYIFELTSDPGIEHVSGIIYIGNGFNHPKHVNDMCVADLEDIY